MEYETGTAHFVGVTLYIHVLTASTDRPLGCSGEPFMALISVPKVFYEKVYITNYPFLLSWYDNELSTTCNCFLKRNLVSLGYI